MNAVGHLDERDGGARHLLDSLAVLACGVVVTRARVVVARARVVVTDARIVVTGARVVVTDARIVVARRAVVVSQAPTPTGKNALATPCPAGCYPGQGQE